MSEPTREDQFRLHQYDQMWRNINRHIFTVWYSVAAVAGAASLLSLVEGSGPQTDAAAALTIILGGWLLAHIYDAQKWFDRNLSIIQECEDHFDKRPLALANHDSDRPASLIGHLSIQRDLALLLVAGAVLYQLTRHANGLGLNTATCSWTFYLPYALIVAGTLRVASIRKSWIQEKERLQGTTT